MPGLACSSRCSQANQSQAPADGHHTGQRSTASRSDLDRRSAGLSAGPRRVRRHRLEGLALVDADLWTPQHVTTVLSAGDLAPGEIEVALVGGSHPDSEALGRSGRDVALPGDPARSSRSRGNGHRREATQLKGNDAGTACP